MPMDRARGTTHEQAQGHAQGDHHGDDQMPGRDLGLKFWSSSRTLYDGAPLMPLDQRFQQHGEPAQEGLFRRGSVVR